MLMKFEQNHKVQTTRNYEFCDKKPLSLTIKKKKKKKKKRWRHFRRSFWSWNNCLMPNY